MCDGRGIFNRRIVLFGTWMERGEYWRMSGEGSCGLQQSYWSVEKIDCQLFRETGLSFLLINLSGKSLLFPWPICISSKFRFPHLCHRTRAHHYFSWKYTFNYMCGGQTVHIEDWYSFGYFFSLGVFDWYVGNFWGFFLNYPRNFVDILSI